MNIVNFKRNALSASIIASTLFTSNTIQAAVLEEVVVTANKRAQSTQDIGVAVSAFNGNDVNDLNLETPTDLAAQTPGLSTTNGTSGGTPIFAIRGIGLDDFNINNSSGTGVYVDEVFASSPMLLGFQLMDVERVEVLKGPQGTLYGKNTTGGAINFVTNKPDDEFSASVTAGYSRWDRTNLEGHINGALSDKVNGRVAYSYSKQNEGWQTDIDTGREFGQVDKFALTGKLAFDLTDTTSILVSAHIGEDNSKPLSPQNDDSEARAIDTLFFPPEFAVGLLDVPADSTSVRAGILDVSRDESGYGGAVTVMHDFENATLLSITGYESYDRDVIDNYDGTSLNFLDLDQSGELEQVSQELRLTSAGDSEYSWIVGLGYSRDEINVLDNFLMFDSTGANLTTAYDQTSTSWGLYFHNEYQLTDIVKLIGGIRYSNDKREFEGGTSSTDGTDLFGAIAALPGSTGAPMPGDLILEQNSSETDGNVSGKIGLDAQLTDDVLVYASVATSYKAGLFYGGVGTTPGVLDYVEPEEVTAYEAGFKSLLLDGSLQLNGAVYSYEYDDRQSLVLTDDSVLFLVATLANVPESTINGAEMDFKWKPTDNLDIQGGVSYMDTKVKNALTNADVRGLNLLSPVSKGTELSQAPEWSYNLRTVYTWDIANDLTVKTQLTYSWTDTQFAALADANAQYGPIRSLGARLALEPNNGDWEVAIWADNIEDKVSETYSFTNNSAARTVYRQKPNNYGITFTYNFQ